MVNPNAPGEGVLGRCQVTCCGNAIQKKIPEYDESRQLLVAIRYWLELLISRRMNTHLSHTSSGA